MTLYRLVAYGRKKGALGVTGFIVEDVEADNPEQARLKLYEKYEHISALRYEILREGDS